jgi:type II secretory ATPase GspE/PulE/Tfp pilus assembly ATPase PilB-like protein
MSKLLKTKGHRNSSFSGDETANKVVTLLHHTSEEKQAAEFAAKINFSYLDTNVVPINLDSLRLISETDSRKFNLAIIQKVGKKVSVISTNPTTEDFKTFLNQLVVENGWEPRIFIVSSYNMSYVWEKYKKASFSNIISQLSVGLSEEDLQNFDEQLKNLSTLKQRIIELPTTQILNVIMGGAYKLGASDVHIEPQNNLFRLRYRLDGVLHDVVELPIGPLKSIVSRIKMMAGMKLNLKDIAQDGAFKVNIGAKKITIRCSVIPGNFGESIVMRLLDPESIQVDLENLGLRGLAYEDVQKQIAAPNGIVLTTGPTGSGKTTTLYAMINKLNNPETKIITIEDPIEYEVNGISQTQIEKSRGYTFASGLRAILRQDPDIILVGEIRDNETADIAVNSSLTGHLVLSTIHTNSAVGTISRLVEMGVNPNLIAPSINALIGQRLVRKLCDCKESYEPAQETVESLKKILSIISPKAKLDIPKTIEKLYRPKGCQKCNFLGYKGRIGVFEVLTINNDLEKLILESAGDADLLLSALESGMVTMLQDGILKSIDGVTSIDEVKRVTGDGDFLEETYENLMAQSLGRKIIINSDIFQKAKTGMHDFSILQKEITSAKPNDIIKLLFASASLLNVSDIHIEPGAEKVRIRFRIDGISQDIVTLPINEYSSVLGEIKILSGVKTEVREGVIDSRFNISFDDDITEIKEHSVDVRVSIILGGYGETAVLRLLSKNSVALDLQALGIREQNLKRIINETSKPNGLILNTGPTGSGKTTTLYSIINKLNNPNIKIITVEDPIEYQIDGILQTSVNDKDGYTFATALRALLRQNPDVLMVGEIRDNETAETAVQAALTGHLVLSTLHTNSAAGAVQRLLNMNISPSDIASAANAFLSQRLVRKLCDCKEETEPTPEQKEKIENVLQSISIKAGVMIPENFTVYKTVGCEKCNHLGYKGRLTLMEVFSIDRDIQSLINNNAISIQLEEKAVENGMITLVQDGILKVLEGETTLDEIERVTNL